MGRTFIMLVINHVYWLIKRMMFGSLVKKTR